MPSSEASYAHRAARFYGPLRCQLARFERIACLNYEMAQLEALNQSERDEHKASCPKCQSGERFACLYNYSVTPEQSKRWDQMRFMTGLIANEERDEEYAQRARVRTVEYKHHIDGFCAYWQNVRHRKFEVVGWKCEHCRGPGPLEAHHKHYDTLGFEEISDLEALCRECHARV